MKLETYHYEIRDILNQFTQAFQGAIISRVNQQRQVVDKIKVRYVYAPKQRVLHDLVNKAQHITLPVVSFQITSIARDVNRVFNKTLGSYRYKDMNVTKTPQPVPVNIGINVSILTRYQSDMDQILSNFVPYCDPYFVIAWKREGLEEEIRTHVTWSGSNNISYPTDINNNQPARVACDTSFTIAGWLFKYDFDPEGLIFNVDANFSAVSDIISLDEMEANRTPENTDYLQVKGRPQIANISPYIKNSAKFTEHLILGDQFNETLGVYLSADDPGMFAFPLSSFDPFGEVPSLSADFPPFEGITAEYFVRNNNAIDIIVPITEINSGKIDIIIVNPAGYGKLTTDTFNPNFDYQPPFVEGLINQ